MSEENKTIVVAMSGGVDSSVAALLLKQQQAELIGVSMQVWDYRKNGGCDSKATCCSPDDFTDARRVAAQVGIPYYVFDLEAKFREQVIDRFVDSYYQGITPNPCVECNNKVKFRELRERSLSLGYNNVATGHYAQIEQGENKWRLLRGADPEKDQSYFLYGLKQAELAKTFFPVGHLCKAEVREIAAQHGLPTASKPESQDICFVSGSVQDFLVKLGKSAGKNGQIVNRSGALIGQHQGIHNYTVGQRKGLGLGGSENPLYVLEIDPANNQVIVGSKEDLETAGLLVNELNWIDPEVLQNLQQNKEVICLAQLRYRHAGSRVKMTLKSPDLVELIFMDDWAVVSPGQAAVFYDLENKAVLGGGKILRALQSI